MTEKPKFVAAPLESYSTEDQAFFKFWYGHMLNDLMQPPLCSVDHATARYIWDAALSSVDAQPVAWTNQQLCDLLPEGVMWGDNLTPELVREILLAASRVPQAAQPVSPAPSDKEAWEIYSRAQQSAGEKKGFALAIAITQAIIAEVRALAAHPVAPGVPEGFRLEKLYEPERIKVEKIGGGFCCFCKTGSGGVETAAFEFLNAMLSASPSLATERDAVDAQKVRNDALEEAANLLESGSFLHDDAPDARLAQSAAKAIRSLQSQPASAGKDAEDARRWISITDRLPEPNQVVCLVDENRWRNTGGDFDVNVHACGYLASVGHQMYWSCFSEPRGLTLDAFTHWTPVPAISAIAQQESGK